MNPAPPASAPRPRGRFSLIRAVAGAVSDVFGKPLGGLVLGTILLAGALLAGLVWATVAYLVPLIPDASFTLLRWQVNIADAASETAASVAAVILAILLLPTVAMIVGGILFDIAADRVEKLRFPNDPPGRNIPVGEAIWNTVKIAVPALFINLACLPLFLIPGVNLIVFLSVNAFLMSREYFSIAALRFHPWTEVKAMRKRHGAAIFAAGLTCAALLLVPIAQFLAPLYGAALMVRLHKALSAD